MWYFCLDGDKIIHQSSTVYSATVFTATDDGTTVSSSPAAFTVSVSKVNFF